MKTTYTRTLNHEGGLLVKLDGDDFLTRLEIGTLLTLTHETWKPGACDELLVSIELGHRTASEFFLPSEIIRIFDPDRTTW